MRRFWQRPKRFCPARKPRSGPEVDSNENIERRKFPRYTHDLPVTYQTLAAELAVHCPHCGGELIVAGRALDQLLVQGTARSTTLSLGGMALDLDHSFAMGKQMLVQFPIRDEMVSARAVVVVSQRLGKEKFRIGVEFTDLSEYNRQVLVDYFADSLLQEARDRNLMQEISTADTEMDMPDPLLAQLAYIRHTVMFTFFARWPDRLAAEIPIRSQLRVREITPVGGDSAGGIGGGPPR